MGLLVPLALYGVRLSERPVSKPVAVQPLFEGITYQRIIERSPRSQVLHLLEIDLTATGLKPFSTPGIGQQQGNAAINTTADKNAVRETQAQKTSSFLQTHNLQLAVNANFFYPFEEKSPWNYGPHEGDTVSLVGIAMSDGEMVSYEHPRYSTLCFLPGRAEIVFEDFCPDGTMQAVAGQSFWISPEPLPEGREFLETQFESPKPYALNIAGLNADGTRLWLLLSDGKQPLYSEGTTLEEAALRLKAEGATDLVQLDGGGSTTLVIGDEMGEPQILNAVVHTKIPGRERPVANHLGFFAEPLRP
ncbi:MAG: phosphodiester glycosidase family protein [Cyanobacteria bacterium J06643_4]